MTSTRSASASQSAGSPPTAMGWSIGAAGWIPQYWQMAIPQSPDRRDSILKPSAEPAPHCVMISGWPLLGVTTLGKIDRDHVTTDI
ncbi:hypothetical protein [Rhizobium sp. WYJ-E13]|uniref:hypothetical protein n=1 Tax=Rhizobium sp. WYJ-E13 TaxID=2849093 RepID=UPI001C1F1F18|nr:hypothetical protein [Rhizobium sp. WYJ-E13]QWW71405.1 hypothetical protein KQ933_22395 [Rhizobium sp. WYJ-E13]